ncbi:MAG: alanine--glyoxylate aminotransferase family protein [Candidatus Rokubacteria bacterium]|nr:alanine--glyoxylate aminotransferase family protein [Candidatus Rokubacteria bacterium]
MSQQHWMRGLERPLLMIPGPTEVPWRVLRAMAQPPMIQYEPPFDDEVLEPACLDLRQVFQTTGEVLAMPGSGRTGLESAAASLVEPGDRVVVVVAGVFGQLMKEIAERVGAVVTTVEVEWGRPLDLEALERTVAQVRPKLLTLVHNETSTGLTYPAPAVGEICRRHGALYLLDTVSSLAGLDVQTDAWGVDVNMTGSQKCLAMPLGLAIVSVSPRAFEAMERRSRKPTTYAYDLVRWKRHWVPASRGGGVPEGGRRSQPVSIPTHLAQALLEAVKVILEEGMPHRIRRHRIAGKALRAGLAGLKLDLFGEPSLASDTVSCFRTPPGIAPGAVVRRMRDAYGILISTGIGVDALRQGALRVGTMGLTASPHYVLPTLSALGMALRDVGYKADTGEALAAAQAVFDAEAP